MLEEDSQKRGRNKTLITNHGAAATRTSTLAIITAVGAPEVQTGVPGSTGVRVMAGVGFGAGVLVAGPG